MVIGGIISEAASTTSSKVPVLGDIPIIGQAFARKSKERDKIETLIFLEAAVVSPLGDSLVTGFEYVDRHLPNGPPIGMPYPPFSQVPLAPLEGHNRIELTPTELKQGLVKPVSTAVEILK